MGEQILVKRGKRLDFELGWDQNNGVYIPADMISIKSKWATGKKIIADLNTIDQMILDAQLRGASNRGKEIITATVSNPDLSIINENDVLARYNGVGIVIEGVTFQATSNPFNEGDVFYSQLNKMDNTPIAIEEFQFLHNTIGQHSFNSELELAVEAVENLVVQLNDSKADKANAIDTAMQIKFDAGTVPVNDYDPTHKLYVDAALLQKEQEIQANETRITAIEQGGAGVVIETSITATMGTSFASDGKLQLPLTGTTDDGSTKAFDYTDGSGIEWIEFYDGTNVKTAITINEVKDDWIGLPDYPKVEFRVNVGGEIQLTDTSGTITSGTTPNFSIFGVGKVRQIIKTPSDELATKTEVNDKLSKISTAVGSVTGNDNIEGSIISMATKLQGLEILEFKEIYQEVSGDKFINTNTIELTKPLAEFDITKYVDKGLAIYFNGTLQKLNEDYQVGKNANESYIYIIKNFGWGANDTIRIEVKYLEGTPIQLGGVTDEFANGDKVSSQDKAVTTLNFTVIDAVTNAIVETTTGDVPFKDNTEGYMSKDKVYEITNTKANASLDDVHTSGKADGIYGIQLTNNYGDVENITSMLGDGGQMGDGTIPREWELNGFDYTGKFTVFVYDAGTDQFVGWGAGASNDKHILGGNRKDFGAITIEVDTQTGDTRLVEHFDREITVNDFANTAWTDKDNHKKYDIELTHTDGTIYELEDAKLHHHVGWTGDHVEIFEGLDQWTHHTRLMFQYNSSLSTTTVTRRSFVTGSAVDGTVTITKVTRKGGQ